MKFERFIKQIDSEYKITLSKAKLSQEILNKLDTILSKDIMTIKGSDFYHILNAISQNFENDVTKAFEEYFQKKKAKNNTDDTINNNKYRDFINQFIVLQQDVAQDAKIEDIRLSRILNREILDFLAWEVYAIAVTRHKNIKSAFEQLYNA